MEESKTKYLHLAYIQIMKKLILILTPLFFLCSMGFAQVEEEDGFLVYGKDTVFPLSDGRILFNEKIYKENSPYLTLAYGFGNNFTQGGLEQDMMITYHHFIGDIGLGIGYHASSDIQVWMKSWHKLNDFWLGAGWRYERLRYNLSIFAGPALAYGQYIEWDVDEQKDLSNYFRTFGGVAEIQFTYRLLYDVGVGVSLYGSMNKLYTVAGAQVHLFFSTAFVRNY